MDPTARFTDRADAYRRARPGYPLEVNEWLRDLLPPGPDANVADVGSGTGIFTRLLLDHGYRVWAVEPNAAMRAKAESDLARTPGFTSVDATAEHTKLPDRSMSLYTAAQAFHWFEPVAARREAMRILRPGASVFLIWNQLDTHASLFARDYRALLLQHCPTYASIAERHGIDDRDRAFWGDAEPRRATAKHAQSLSAAGLADRVRSSSYAPKPDDPHHDALFRELAQLFTKYQANGVVELPYRCDGYWGVLK